MFKAINLQLICLESIRCVTDALKPELAEIKLEGPLSVGFTLYGNQICFSASLVLLLHICAAASAAAAIAAP